MSKQQEALQFLDDLDSLNAPSSSKPAPPTVSANAQPANEAEALAFLEEITQKSSEPTRTTTTLAPQPRTLTPRTSSRISLRKGADGVSRSSSPAPAAAAHAQFASGSGSPGDGSGGASAPSDTANGGAGAWGWGSVWSSASAAVKQARSAVDEQVKNLPKNEQAKKWSEGMLEYVKNAQLDKLGGFHFFNIWLPCVTTHQAKISNQLVYPLSRTSSTSSHRRSRSMKSSRSGSATTCEVTRV